MHRRKFCLSAAGVLVLGPLSGTSPSVTLPVKAKERRKYYRGPAGGELALVRHSEGIFYRWSDGTELYGGSPVVDGEPAPSAAYTTGTTKKVDSTKSISTIRWRIFARSMNLIVLPLVVHQKTGGSIERRSTV